MFEPLVVEKVNQCDCLDPETLAEGFGVHRRTIMRDFNERFAFLPLNVSV